MNRQYESMTKAIVNGYTVRVWCEEKQFTLGPDPRVVDALARVKWRIEDDPTLGPELISKTLDALPKVSAYEILDAKGDGAIVYPDWK